MATANLVDTLISDGQRLLAHLAADKVEVTVAFWAQVGDERRWLFYIGCHLVDNAGLAMAYQEVSKAFDHLRSQGTLSFEEADLRLIGATSIIATAAVQFRERFKQHGARQAMVHSAWQVFGPLAMQDVWVYGDT